MGTSDIHVLQDALKGDLVSTAGSVAILAVSLHWLVFRVITVENHLALLLWSYVVGVAGLGYAYIALANFSLLQTLVRLAVVTTAFNASLALSIGAYRLFFHRIRRFPGPFWSKLTRFSDVSLAAKEVKYYREVAKMHETYGDFIRTGNNLLDSQFCSVCLCLVFRLCSSYFALEMYSHMHRSSRNLYRTQVCHPADLRPTIPVLEDDLVCPSVSQP